MKLDLHQLATALGDRVVYVDDHVILLCGKWQDVLPELKAAGVEQVDACITDLPYSERTHDAQVYGGRDARREGMTDPRKLSKPLPYACWSTEEALQAAGPWSAMARGWMVVMSDHGLAAVWEKSMQDWGRYVFAPLPFVAPGSRIRLAGDGPSTWTIWITVGRPKTRDYQRWGTLDGAYVLPPGHGQKPMHMGGKHVWLMRELVSDYSREGDVIVDPCAGGCTTGVAAKQLGRQCILIEMDPKTCEIGAKRLANTKIQIPMRLEGEALTGEQQGLFKP